jgi:hypothetical protein
MKLLANHSSSAIALFLLGGAAVFAPTASAASVDTYPNFLNLDEISLFTSVDVDFYEEGGDEGVCYRDNKYYGAAAFSKDISSRLHDVTGTQLTAEEQHQRRRSVPVTMITGDTKTHVDHYYSGDSPGTEVVEDKVAFVFLNDNPDAKFVYGTTEVAAEAGKLVVFNGNVLHNTQVAQGTLSLAGPFHLRSLSFVGDLDDGYMYGRQ